MEANCSNDSIDLPHPNFSSTVNNLPYKCFSVRVGVLNITVFTIISILVFLPLYVLVYFLAYQRWRQQRSSASISHSDLFTYHMIAIELINILGSTLSCCGIYADIPEMFVVGLHLIPINLTGQLLFHILTCVGRYLAVVHPLIYLGLKKTNGIRIRNAAIGCAWLLCFLGISRLSTPDLLARLMISSFVGCFAVTVISFCSISVLCALVRSGPGEGDRQRVRKSRLRVLYTITVILGVLILRSGGVMLSTGLFYLPGLTDDDKCGLWVSAVWICMPSSLVLPLLFLHRAGKLTCCKKNSKLCRGTN